MPDLSAIEVWRGHAQYCRRHAPKTLTPQTFTREVVLKAAVADSVHTFSRISPSLKAPRAPKTCLFARKFSSVADSASHFEPVKNTKQPERLLLQPG